MAHSKPHKQQNRSSAILTKCPPPPTRRRISRKSHSHPNLANLLPDPSRLSSRATCQPHPQRNRSIAILTKCAPPPIRRNLAKISRTRETLTHPDLSSLTLLHRAQTPLLTTNNQLAMSTPTIANANSMLQEIDFPVYRDIYKPGEARPTYTRAPRRRQCAVQRPSDRRNKPPLTALIATLV